MTWSDIGLIFERILEMIRPMIIFIIPALLGALQPNGKMFAIFHALLIITLFVILFFYAMFVPFEHWDWLDISLAIVLYVLFAGITSAIARYRFAALVRRQERDEE